MIVGVGVDDVDVGRLRAVLARTPSMRRRLFTDGERAYAELAREPAQRFAARFAAKEAVLKSMGVGLGACRWTDIEVARDDDGAPSLVLHGRATELAAARGIARWHLSLTHDGGRAVAFVVAET
ncbi:MAG: holo-ACP synthase [Acidimicrobiales bacterium]